MTIHFLPDVYSRATQTTVVVPVSDVPDLTDPSNFRVVIPTRVEITLTLFEGGPRGNKACACVHVIGPRRLKSGAAGKPIATVGWESARNEGPRGYVARPPWLTRLLPYNLPAGWSPSLLELPGGAS